MAQDRDLNVNVTATTAKFDRGMRKAAAEARKLEQALVKQQREAEKFRTNTGKAMLGAGAGILAATGLAVKAAIEWESAWAGVTKTVDGSGPQMAKLEGQLRSMARELPATHQEIAAVAEAAGQLGIERESIASFTRVMVALGETTNLSADEAATALAQLSNVMGTSQGDIGQMGSALVALGNAGASTEADIVNMSLRLAGAAKLIGASEADVLGLANAMASVGIETELGGSAMSRTMQKIFNAVKSGGEELEAFAEVAGMTADDFAAKFESSPAEAINAFVGGLDRVDQSGGNVIETLGSLGIKGSQDVSVLLRLKGAGDLLTESLQLGSRAWEENSALVEEAAKRYETTEAKMQVARNNITDLGITIGETFLPIIGDFAETIRGLILVFQDLPAPIKTALTIFGSLAGAVSLVGGAALLAGPKIAKLRTAAETMATSASRLNRGLGAVGTFLTGPWGAAIGAATIAVGFFAASKAEAAVEVDKFTQAIEADNGVLGENSRLTALKALQDRGMTDALRAAKIPLADVVDALTAQDGSLDGVIARMRAYEESIGGVANPLDSLRKGFLMWGEDLGINESGVQDNERALYALADSLAEARNKAKEQKEVFGDELPGALKETEETAHELTGTQQTLADKFDLTKSEAEDASAAIEEYLDILRRATDPVFALIDALDGVESAQAEYNKAVKDHGKNSDEAKAASIGLAKAVAGAEAAAINGDLSYDEFKATLKRWVSQGVITAEQAKTIRERVKEARKEAEDYKGDYTASLHAKTKQAKDAITDLRDHWNKRLQEIRDEKVNVGVAMSRPPELRYPGMGRESGGILPGPPSDRDNMLLWAASGEYVVNARSTQKYRGLLEAINSDLLPGYAVGGQVGGITATGSSEGVDETLQAIRANILTVAQAAMAVLAPVTGGGGGVPSSVSGNAAIVQSIFASMFGWGAHWPATYRLLMKESGFRNTAQNPTSTAYGMFQFLDSTWGGYGIPKTSDPRLQTIAGGRYIRSRYGNPSSALAFHNAHNWYDRGGLAAGRGFLEKRTLQPERVLSPRQTASFERLVTVLDNRSGSSTVRLHPDDIRAVAKAQTRELIQRGKWLVAVNTGKRADILSRAG